MFTVNITGVERVTQYRNQSGSLDPAPYPISMAPFTLRRSSNITFRQRRQLRQPSR